MLRTISRVLPFLGLAFLVACNQTTNTGQALSTNSQNAVAPTAGGQPAQAKAELMKCDAPVATVVLSTDQQAAALAQYGLSNSSLPAMRVVARQSNCFTIVNREVAGTITGSRIMAPEYTVMVEVLVNKEEGGAGSAASALLGFIPYVGGIASAAATGVRTHSAQVVLTLIDNRSAVEVTSVTGRAAGASYNLTSGGYGDAGGYDSSEQGKIVISAMVDAMNQLIPQIGPTGKPRM